MSEAVTVLIDGERFAFWSELELTLALDAFWAVSFTAPFEPERAKFRSIFRPFSFKPLQILLNGAPLFSGTLVGIEPRAQANQRTVEVTGYALAAVLSDCSAPASTVPHEFKKLSLGQIIQAICNPFGLRVQMRDPGGAVFPTVKIEEDQKLFEFIVNLAKQRNLVLSNTNDGQPICWKSVAPGNPVARLKENLQPVSNVTAEFSPQDYFSEITGFATATRKHGGAKYTAKNKWLPNVLRPTSFKLDDTDRGDAAEATKARLGRMFAGMASWTYSDIPTWRDPQGDLWYPNTTIKLTAPSAMIYRETELLIRTVKLSQDADKVSATLNLVLPGAFSGELPEQLPWSE